MSRLRGKRKHAGSIGEPVMVAGGIATAFKIMCSLNASGMSHHQALVAAFTDL
jgi:hypothetical protein